MIVAQSDFTQDRPILTREEQYHSIAAIISSSKYPRRITADDIKKIAVLWGGEAIWVKLYGSSVIALDRAQYPNEVQKIAKLLR